MLYSTLILATAKKIGVAGSLLLAICTQESGLNNVVVPHDGGSPSYGICQVKEGTARHMGYKGHSKDLMDPATNIKWAAIYLKFQLDRYDNDWCKATAAYNAGSFNESKRYPGKPRNMKYIRLVQANLEKDLHYKLSCPRMDLTEADGRSYGHESR